MPSMRIEIVPDDAALALRAARAIAEAVGAHPAAALGLPTGNTPIRAYAELARLVETGAADLRRATAWAIDEFADATRDTAGTNSVFYREYLRVPLRALHVPNPGARDPDEHIRAFAAALARAGGLDLCILGIGRNGHVAFNEPPSACDAVARVVDLTPTSREAHATTFGALDRVPRRGMTLGITDIMASRAMLVLAHGAHKAAIVQRAIEEPPTADVPASWLQSHRDVTWLLDTAAAAQLTRR